MHTAITGTRLRRLALVACLATATAVTPSVAQGAAAPGDISVMAFETSPIGFASAGVSGCNGTPGGGSGPVVTASTSAQLLAAIARTDAVTIRVTARITFSGMQDVAPNKTIIGVGASGGISGGGLDLDGTRNVVIRNLTFTNAADDSINMQDGTRCVWIDHNDFSAGHDGALDIKRGTDFVTVSWNRFHNHDKTSLVGHSDDNASQDLGHLRVTYHHNFFDGTVQRHPRVRFADPVHVFNNCFRSNSGYGVASTMNAGVLVEGNFFDNVDEPMVTQTGDSDPGRIVERNNVFSGSGTPERSGTVVEPRTFYSYTLEPASGICTSVPNGSGVGRI